MARIVLSQRNLMLTGAMVCALAVNQAVKGQVYSQTDASTHPDWIAKDGTTVSIVDFANAPLSGTGGSITSFGGNTSLAGQLGRLNFLRSEPTTGAAPALLSTENSRFFVADNNRNLYILNKSQASGTTVGAGFTPYINMQAVFPEFDNNPGYAGGLVTFQFDPGYSNPASPGYGKFYTVHTENITGTAPNSAKPINANLAGLTGVSGTVGGASAYGLTTPLQPATTVSRESVLVEWTDTNPGDSTFQGTAREVMRAGFTGNLHPMGDLIFNPNAQPGDADYRNLYIANGDGGAGESTGALSTYSTPQRLDSIQGKVLRITPDITLHPGDALGSNGNSTYRVPSTGADANPFVQVTGAKKEVYAYGFRNIHRLSWDPVTNKLIGNDIGLYSFEEVNVINKGNNYGWSEREGNRVLSHLSGQPGDAASASIPGARTSPLTANDSLSIRVSDTVFVSNVATGTTTTNAASAAQASVRYPAASFFQTEGDAISSGFVYRGTALQGLQGKYIFGDITTGRIFFTDINELIAADDFNAATQASVHELSFTYNGAPTSIYDLVVAKYGAKGGSVSSATSVLPGFAANVGGGTSIANQGTDTSGNPIYDTNPNAAAATPGFTPDYAGGRADVRLAVGGDGEIYILSKSDGMIRMLTGVVALGTAAVPEPASLALLGTGGLLMLRRRRR